MSESLPKPLPVALVYGESESSQVLRDALGEIGADLVCDADIGSFSMDNLGASGADVVLISLDAIIEDRLDEVYGSLDEERYRVMFDDPEISNKLDGWEHARWQRHLAAKLRDISDWDPPRPEDAVAVEVNSVTDVPAQSGAEAPDWMNDALSVLNDTDSTDNDSDDGEGEGELSSVVSSTDQFAADAESETDRSLAPSAGSEADDSPEPPAAAPADEPAIKADTEATPELSGTAAEDDAALQAELDALADADDPLAALQALAGDQAPPAASSPADVATEVSTPDSGDHDDAELPAVDEIQGLSADTADVDAGGAIDEPESGLAPTISDDNEPAAADEGDADWGSLEAELNDAFDSDTLGAIEQASDAPGEYSVEVPSWELQSSDGAPELDDSEAQPEALPETPRADNGETSANEVVAGAADEPGKAKPSTHSAATAESTEDGTDLPDVSQWALVDDDEPPAQAAEQPVQIDTPGEAAEVVLEDSADGQDGSEDDDNFGLELVDPIDYLKPEVPKDVSNELFSMPTLMPMAEAVAPKVGDEDESEMAQPGARIERVVVLGASIGGPDAVREFLSHLPQRLPACLVLVQHLGSEFVDLMVSQLSKSSALPVRIPGRAERAIHGEVLVVPNGCQLGLTQDGQLEIRELGGDAANNPSINLTMSMAAERFGAAATAIIFSGMASDAVAGALEIASRGGEVWVQDPESCVVSNMVDDVVEAGVARFTGSPEALAHKLVAFLQEVDDE